MGLFLAICPVPQFKWSKYQFLDISIHIIISLHTLLAQTKTLILDKYSRIDANVEIHNRDEQTEKPNVVDITKNLPSRKRIEQTHSPLSCCSILFSCSQKTQETKH